MQYSMSSLIINTFTNLFTVVTHGKFRNTRYEILVCLGGTVFSRAISYLILPTRRCSTAKLLKPYERATVLDDKLKQRQN